MPRQARQAQVGKRLNDAEVAGQTPLPLNRAPNTTSVRHALLEPIPCMVGVQLEGISRKLSTHRACTPAKKKRVKGLTTGLTTLA